MWIQFCSYSTQVLRAAGGKNAWAAAALLPGPLSQSINTSNHLCQGNFLVATVRLGCEAPLTCSCPVLTLVIAAGAIMTILLKLAELTLYLETHGTGWFIFTPFLK